MSRVVTVSLLISLCFHGVIMSQEKPAVVKFVRYQLQGNPQFGVVEGDQVRQVSGSPFAEWSTTEQTYPLADLEILVPTTPSKVIALAGNYRDHLGDAPTPETPEPFFKLPSCLVAHEAKVIQPPDHEGVHYEAEVVVVIGRRAKDVSVAEASDYILGITCGNDISARKWQSNDKQWWRAKGSDTFGPCGPYVVTGLDYANLAMELRVNGEVRQKTNTKNMIHSIDEAVSFISRYVTLEPGDLIYTGTPGKTQSLNLGDRVEVEIEGVGVLKNQLAAAD